MTVLTLSRLSDPVTDVIGEPVSSFYAERFWLPVLGPTSMWLLRHCARHTERGDYVVDAEELGRLLGVGGHGGRHSPLLRSLERLRHFHLAALAGENAWALPAFVGMVSRPLLQRLPESLRREHDLLTGLARERAVPCAGACGRETWSPDALCDPCRDRDRIREAHHELQSEAR